MVYTANHPERGLTPPDNDNKTFAEIENEIVLARLNDDYDYYLEKRKEKQNSHRWDAIDRLLNYIENKINKIKND